MTGMKESNSINSSLNAFEKVLNTLAFNNIDYIPYRLSKLNRILKNYLKDRKSVV